MIIYNVLDVMSVVVGIYNVGEIVNYNGKLMVGNVIWLCY